MDTIRSIAAMITAGLVYVAVAVITFPFYYFFELSNGKSWTNYMGEILNYNPDQ